MHERALKRWTWKGQWSDHKAAHWQATYEHRVEPLCWCVSWSLPKTMTKSGMCLPALPKTWLDYRLFSPRAWEYKSRSRSFTTPLHRSSFHMSKFILWRFMCGTKTDMRSVIWCASCSKTLSILPKRFCCLGFEILREIKIERTSNRRCTNTCGSRVWVVWRLLCGPNTQNGGTCSFHFQELRAPSVQALTMLVCMART
jgi:hypothetical protein